LVSSSGEWLNVTGQSMEGVVFAISILQKTLGRAFSNQWRMVQKTKGLENKIHG